MRKNKHVIPAQAGIQLTTNLIAITCGLILTISYLLSPISIHAQEATDSGLLQKLNQLKSEIASKAAEIKNEVNKKVQNKAMIGKILLIDPAEMTIQTLNTTRTIKYDEFTEIIGAKGKEIKAETLETDDNIAALGDIDDKNNLVAQKLIFLENFASTSAQLVWGQIQKSQGSIITVKTKDGETKNITTNAQTQFFLDNNEASLSDAKVEQFLLTRATTQKDGSLKARFIYFIPSMGFTKPIEKSDNNLKTASPSAASKR